MRFLTSLLPLITLALRVAATDRPGSNSIPLANIGHPEPVHLYGNNIYFADEEAANPGTRRQRPPCRNCLEKAKDIVATKIKAPVNALKVIVGSSPEVIKENALASTLIFVACVTVGTIALAFFCGLEMKEFEWCREVWDGSNKSRRDSGYPACQRLECGADVCGVPQTSLTSGGHPKRDLARTLYRRRLEGLDDEDKNE
ncbi:hypothetical protein F5876DRAFT_71778 [Lentinula aff. lateritia]|uniref:Uncharacterized protein n=1 Tax=Lentinula aff. lateritia TaxID=2804960 RepID=A0ACC1UGM5_9AGAR|nr:hypothetical protein F5876DRAFT_71778 [Lentinula aff. lateritia]